MPMTVIDQTTILLIIGAAIVIYVLAAIYAMFVKEKQVIAIANARKEKLKDIDIQLAGIESGILFLTTQCPKSSREIVLKRVQAVREQLNEVV